MCLSVSVLEYVCLCVCLLVCVSWSVSVCLCVSLIVCMSLCLRVCLSVCFTVYLSMCLPVGLHRRRQPYSRGSTCCPIICAGPAPNAKCCPIFGIGLNINGHELVNYRRVIKTVATRCQIFRPKCTKFDFGWGSAPDAAGGDYSAPLDPLAAFKGAYF